MSRDGYEGPEEYEIPGLGVVSRERAKEIRSAIGQQDRAHREAWEQRQRDAGQVWVAHYWRHYSEYRDEFFSLNDAYKFLQFGEEEGQLSASGVILPGGEEVSFAQLEKERRP